MPTGVHTNMFPFMAGLKDLVAYPQRNDEIFLPTSWSIVRDSAATAEVCPAALSAWAREVAQLRKGFPKTITKTKDKQSLSKSINSQLSCRLSDHLACFVEAEIPHN